MILESIVTTVDDENNINVAPMGPLVDPELTHFTLRPFRPSATYENLRLTRRAVIHVTDDVLLIAKAVTHQLFELPATWPLERGRWQVLTRACRYFAVEVDEWQEDGPRATAICRVMHAGEQRPFFGLNRAKHAVIEGAILASRKHLLPRAEIVSGMQQLRMLVDKTAGPDELTAMELLEKFLEIGTQGLTKN